MSKFRPNIAVSCVLFAVFLYALGLVFAKTQKSVPNASATFLPTSNSHSMWGGPSNTVDAAKSSEQDTCFKGNRAHLSVPKNVKETFAPSKGGSADGVTALDLLLINNPLCAAFVGRGRFGGPGGGRRAPWSPRSVGGAQPQHGGGLFEGRFPSGGPRAGFCVRRFR